MKKKGFTLVELLAVIAILSVLVIIALPNIVGMFTNAKKDIFLTEAKKIYNESASKYISNSMNELNAKNVYCKSISDDINPLDLSSSDIYYYIEKDSSGNTKTFVAWNNSGYIVKAVNDKVELKNIDKDSVIESNVSDINCNNVLEKVGLKKVIDYSLIKFTLGDTESRILTMTLDTKNQDVGEVKYKVYMQSPKKTVELSSSDYANKYYVEFKDFTYNDQFGGFQVTAIINGKEFSKKSIGPACFVAGTKVKTEDGFKNIEDIKENELIYTYNLDTNMLELKPVKKAIISMTIETYLLQINDKIFEVTPRHELYIIDKGWVRASNVKVGDNMLDSSSNKQTITGITYKKYDEPIKTYNLSVDGNSNYFVTDIQVLVHNIGSGAWSYNDKELLK